MVQVSFHQTGKTCLHNSGSCGAVAILLSIHFDYCPCSRRWRRTWTRHQGTWHWRGTPKHWRTITQLLRLVDLFSQDE